jgi:hypothetical protein
MLDFHNTAHAHLFCADGYAYTMQTNGVAVGRAAGTEPAALLGRRFCVWNV